MPTALPFTVAFLKQSDDIPSIKNRDLIQQTKTYLLSEDFSVGGMTSKSQAQQWLQWCIAYIRFLVSEFGKKEQEIANLSTEVQQLRQEVESKNIQLASRFEITEMDRFEDDILRRTLTQDKVRSIMFKIPFPTIQVCVVRKCPAVLSCLILPLTSSSLPCFTNRHLPAANCQLF